LSYAYTPMSVLFTPNDKNLIPTSLQYTFGLSIEEIMPDVKFEMEAYLKNYNNLASSYQYLSTACFEDGKAYGLDVTFAKFKGFITGWLGYSLSRSVKYGADYNYYSAQDRLHNLKLLSEFNLSEHFKVSLFYNYASGIHFTPYQYAYKAIASLNQYNYFYFFYPPSEEWRLIYGKKNSVKAPDYRRLDLSISGNFIWYKLLFTPYLQIMNILNQKNLIFYDYKIYSGAFPYKEENIGSFIIPSIGINIEYQF